MKKGNGVKMPADKHNPKHKQRLPKKAAKKPMKK